MNICGHEDVFFLVFTSFWQKNEHLRACLPFFFGHHFFSGRNIFSIAKWGCENWLVMQKGCQQVKRLKTTAVGAALSLALAVSYVDKQLSASLSVQEVWGSNPGSVKSARNRQRFAIVATFFRCVLPKHYTAKMGAATRHTLRCNTTSIMKI